MRMEKMPHLPQIIKYGLFPINSIIKVKAYYTKNPVGAYDYTILNIIVEPLLTFPFTIDQLTLSFSDEKMNKEALPKTERDKLPLIFKAGEKYEYEAILYIQNNNIGSPLLLYNASFIMKRSM